MTQQGSAAGWRGRIPAQHDATGLSGTRAYPVNQSAAQPGYDVTQSGSPRHCGPTRAQAGGIPRTPADMETEKQLIRWPTVVKQSH